MARLGRWLKSRGASPQFIVCPKANGNPKTGAEVPILPRRVLVFRPSQVLKARVNEKRRPRTAE